MTEKEIRPRTRTRRTVRPEVLNEDQLRLEIGNDRYHEIFDYLGRSPEFNRVITRSRNPDVDHDRAWDESQRLFEYIYPDILNPQVYNPNVVKNAFLAERERFVRTLRDSKNFRTEEIRSNYRLSKSRAFRELSEENDIRRHEILSEILFEQGFFRK